MKFWYTEKVGYLLLILALVIPYNLMLQIITEADYHLVLMAALWQYLFYAPDYVYFAISPIGLIYFFWYGPNVYIAKLAYDAAKKDNWMRKDYAIRTVMVIVLQILIILFLPVSSGYPPLVNIPLPIAGIIALLLTPLTVKTQTKVWDDPPPDIPSENEVFLD